MDRLFRLVIVLSALGLAIAAPAAADPPVPEPWTAPQCVPFSPDSSLAYTVTMLDFDYQPIVDCLIEVRFTAVADTLICWCSPRPPQRPPSFFARTNAAGIATFHFAGSGCIQYGLFSIPGPMKCAGEVFADGIKLQEFGVVSPDAVDAAGRLATSSPVWQPGFACAVGLADAVQHTTALATSAYEWCTDITGDKVCGASDAVILTPYLAGGTSCAGGRSVN